MPERLLSVVTFHCRRAGAIGVFHIGVSIVARDLDDAQTLFEEHGLSYERAGCTILPAPEDSQRGEVTEFERRPW